MDLPLGIKGERSAEVSVSNTAKAMGSGSLEVFATPAMIALMEGAAVQALEPYQASSVGTALDVKHLAATPLGMRVWAVAQLIETERRRLIFSVEAFDEVEKIGEGRHERFLIQDEAFLKKAYAKTTPGAER
ncbi:fluoroacetyl-CoA thioesterase [Peptococcaceae bacterium CEB3]|nr:fluoroacetyl-CoA thioesterase [Peptococcaceae bacterium CEB3]